MKKLMTLLIILAVFTSAEEKKPNIIYILADDLGYNEVGCYGQKKIKTPHIDKLALEGMKFTNHYSGSAVCAPSRCVLLTGKHTGRSYIRNNRGRPVKGQFPISDETVTLGELLQKQGYKTCVVGKWGLGGPDTTGLPNKQGFDHFYGYLDQWRAHNYYPTYLYRNNTQVPLRNPDFKSHQKIKKAHKNAKDWKQYSGRDWAEDLMTEECLSFIKKNKDKPFFLYFASPVPHVAIQVPEEAMAEYEGKFPETPYLGQKGYLPHPKPRTGYAAMVTRFDKHIGQIMSLLKELKIDDNTIVIFSSDNGPTFNGGSDSAFFESNKPFSGLKCSLKEGGIRVPMIVRWPGKIKANSVTHHISAFDDVLPTLMELSGGKTPKDCTGLSFLPALLGKEQKARQYLYWEFGRQQAIRVGDWKLYRTSNKTGKIKSFLYNLKDDVAESKNLAAEKPDVLHKLIKMTKEARTVDNNWKAAWDKE